MLRSLFLAALFSFILLAPISAGDLEPDGSGRYGVELNVGFLYKEEDVDKWKPIFTKGSQMLWDATASQIYIKKVTFYNDCPTIDANDLDSSGLRTSVRNKANQMDVLIYKATGGGIRTSTTVGRLHSKSSGPIVLYEEHALAPNFQETLGHELAHYVLDVADEYKGVLRPLGLASEEQAEFQQTLMSGLGRVVLSNSRDIEFRNAKVAPGLPEATRSLLLRKGLFFCSEPFDSDPRPASSIMDAFISASGAVDYHKFLCNPRDHIAAHLVHVSLPRSTVYRGGDFANLTRDQIINELDVNRIYLDDGELLVAETQQQQVRFSSCATQGEETLRKWWGANVNFSDRAGDLAGSAPGIEFKEEDDCKSIVIFLIDKSGSMQGARLNATKRAAIGAIDALDGDEVKLGIVAFDSQPRVAVGITELDEVRDAAKAAVSTLNASGGTRIGFGLGIAYEQLRMLRDDPDQAEEREIIFLMTDGVSEDDTTTVTEVIKNDGVEISVVALGEAVDLAVLNGIVIETGGTFYQAAQDEDIPTVFTQGVLQDLEGLEPLSRSVERAGEGAALETLNFFVDRYAERVSVLIQLTDVDTASLALSDFIVTAPDGSVLSSSLRGEIRDGELTLIIPFDSNVSGDYSVRVPSSILRSGSVAEILAFSRSDKMKVFGGIGAREDDITGDAGTFEFPEAVPLNVSVSSEIGNAQNVSVVAEITRPDETVVRVPLRDTGAKSFGDATASDGEYSALFRAFNGDGTYSVEILIDNEALTGVGSFGVHSEPEDIPFGRFDRFFRTINTSFTVTGYQNLGASELKISDLDYPLETRFVPYLESGENAMSEVIMGFAAEVTGPQPILISSFPIEVDGDLDIATISGIELYVDSDNDGFPDNSGETFQAIATADFSIVDKKLILNDPLIIEPGTKLNLLVLARFDQKIRSEIPVEAGFPLMAILAIFSGSLFRRRKSGFVAMMLIVAATSLLIGCGSSNHSFFQTSPVSPTGDGESSVALEIRQASFRVDVTGVKAVGAFDALPATVTVDDEVQGPNLVLEVNRVAE